MQSCNHAVANPALCSLVCACLLIIIHCWGTYDTHDTYHKTILIDDNVGSFIPMRVDGFSRLPNDK